MTYVGLGKRKEGYYALIKRISLGEWSEYTFSKSEYVSTHIKIVVKTWEFEVGKDAYVQEQKILKDFKEYKYNGKDLLVSGNTELFYKDVLMLEYMKGY